MDVPQGSPGAGWAASRLGAGETVDAARGASSGGSRLIALRSILEPLDFGELFPGARSVEVELGAGDGSFLLAYARAHPEHCFLGVERLLGRLRKTDRKLVRAGLTNVRLLRLEARYLVEYLLPPASVDALHVYFPDPWPKRRHWKNRLVDPAFASAVGRVLRPGGRFYFRTDNVPYWAQARECFGACPLFAEADVPAELAAVRTDFEAQFLSQGVATLPLAFRRV